MGTYPPPSPTQTLRQGVGIRGAVPLCRGEVIGLPLRYSLHVAHVLFLAFVAACQERRPLEATTSSIWHISDRSSKSLDGPAANVSTSPLSGRPGQPLGFCR